MDLVYPIPELTPFIGKKRNPTQRESQIPVRQLRSKISLQQQTMPRSLKPNEDPSAMENGVEVVISPRKELTSSAISVRSKSMGPGK